MRHTDTVLLHPEFSRLVHAVTEECESSGLPLRIFETVRSPERQNALYLRGRDPEAVDYGRTVTRARAYQSAHQFGLAVDCVFWIGAKWSWETPPGRPGAWHAYQAIAREHGLAWLAFEKPHIQVRGFDWRDFTPGPPDEPGWMRWLQERRVT